MFIFLLTRAVVRFRCYGMHLMSPFEIHAFGICVLINLILSVCIFGVCSRRMDAAVDRNYLSPFLKKYPATSSSGKNFRSLCFSRLFLYKQARTNTHTSFM